MRQNLVVIALAIFLASGTINAGNLVRTDDQEPWQRVGIATKPAMDTGGYLFTVNPTSANTSTGYFIPNDIESAINELNKMLPVGLQKMIVNNLMTADAFNCDMKIYPKCFEGYYTSLDDYLEHIWGLKKNSMYAKYFQVHQIDGPEIMIDITMHAFHDTHIHKPIDYNELFRQRNRHN